MFRHPGEANINLLEYLVVLDKPIGLSLAPDPKTGQIVVQDIKPRSPADLSAMIQVGDLVKSCSAVFGDEMWQATDIRRVRWAINNRSGQIKLILERRAGIKGGRPEVCWYVIGKPGTATSEREPNQFPFSFHSQGPDDWSLEMVGGAGRAMQVRPPRGGGGADGEMQVAGGAGGRLGAALRESEGAGSGSGV